MASVAQSVERRTVDAAVAGSSPVARPHFFKEISGTKTPQRLRPFFLLKIKICK